MIKTNTIYSKRFNKQDLESKNKLWKTLCKVYFQKYINEKDIVCDIGAGYCEFINNIQSKKKIAIDLNPQTKQYANPGTTVIQKDALKTPKKYYSSINVVFISNFLEHLSSKEEVIETLTVSYNLLKKDGIIIILQPNIDLVKEKYWDFIDHKIPLNTKSMLEALNVTNFKVEESFIRFLPYTTKSVFPQNDLFVKLYLSIPPSLRPLAGQSLFIGKK